MKRSAMKRSPGQEEFWRAVTYDGTAVCWFGLGMDYEDARCDYWNDQPDAHHLISKQLIRSHFATLARVLHPFVPAEVEAGKDTALSDPRNGIPLCRFHHGQLENHRIYIARDELPEGVFSFAKDYGLETLLDRSFPERETDAA